MSTQPLENRPLIPSDLFFTADPDHYDEIAPRINRRYKKVHRLQNEIVIDHLVTARNGVPLILDLGCGTGGDLRDLLELCTHSVGVGVDSSARMLAKARLNLSGRHFLGRFGLLQADIRNLDLSGLVDRLALEGGKPNRPDVVLSALTLHHFDRNEKRRIYQAVAAALKPGGLFTNADLFTSPLLRVAEKMLAHELKGIERGLQGTINASGEYTKWVDHYTLQNKPLTLSEEFLLLQEAGFTTVDVVFRDSQLAVIVAGGSL